MIIYTLVSMLIMFVASLILLDAMREVHDVTMEHMIKIVTFVLLAPLTLPLVLILEFTPLNLDTVIFKKKA